MLRHRCRLVQLFVQDALGHESTKTLFCAESRVAQKLGIVLRFKCKATFGAKPAKPVKPGIWCKAHEGQFSHLASGETLICVLNCTPGVLF